MEISTITDVSDREDAINQLLEGAVNNPLIDNESIARLFSDMAGEVLIYERTGLTLLLDMIQGQVDDSGYHKSFLESFTNPEQTITVHMAIQGSIL